MNYIISTEALKTLMSSPSKRTVIEALPPKYYAAEHLPGAINIPHDEIQQAAPRLIPNKSEQVIVYCASSDCKNSHLAAETLRGLGYDNVYEYAEGKKGWKEAGFSFENGGGLK